MCLGHADSIDLRAALRSDQPDIALDQALSAAMQNKPERHEFNISRPGVSPAVNRHMSVTGG